MPATYKESGFEWVGPIPSEWAMSKIHVDYSVKLGKMVESEQVSLASSLHPYLCAANIKWAGIDTSVQKEMYFTPAELRDNLVREGDALITEGGSIGTTCIYHGEFGECGIQNSVLRARGMTETHTRFLYYWLTLVESSGYLDSICNRATIAHYTKEKVDRTPIVRIPDNELCVVVRLLDEKTAKYDKAGELLEEQIEALEGYRKSLIQEAVTKGLSLDADMKPSGIDWIGDIPTGWRTTKLKGLVRHFESGTSVRAAQYPAIDGEPGVLSLSAVFQGRFNAEANKAVGDDEAPRLSCPVRYGTLLVSRCNTSEWVGTAALVDKECDNLYLPDKIWQIDCETELHNRYVRYALSSPYARAYCWMMSVGASESMQNIASFDLLNMPFAIPETINEMQTVVEYLDGKTSKVDALIAGKRKQLETLRAQRQSLIYEYVTGKRRVV